MREDFLWVEKWRPKTIEDCILAPDMKANFADIKERGLMSLPNMLLSGTPGTGKTTIARALCHEFGIDPLFINASESGGIDTIRTKIRQYASTMSLDGDDLKVVILDEADHLSRAAQPALRGFIEEFANNCRFIFTANYKSKIIEPLHSRLAIFDFVVSSADKNKLMAQLMKRTQYILEKEGIELKSPKALVDLILKFYPDNRAVLNNLQRYSAAGVIDEGLLSILEETSTEGLIDLMKEKKFKEVRQWAASNVDNNVQNLLTDVYERLFDVLEPASIPHAVMIIQEGMYRSAFIVNQEVSLFSTLIEIMGTVEFK